MKDDPKEATEEKKLNPYPSQEFPPFLELGGIITSLEIQWWERLCAQEGHDDLQEILKKLEEWDQDAIHKMNPNWSWLTRQTVKLLCQRIRARATILTTEIMPFCKYPTPTKSLPLLEKISLIASHWIKRMEELEST